MPKEKEVLDSSALNEYFNLKQKLCLTSEERFRLKYFFIPKIRRQLENKIKIRNLKELVAAVRNYKNKYHLTLDMMGNVMGIHRAVLSRILLEQVVPQPKTVMKLRHFMEYYT